MRRTTLEPVDLTGGEFAAVTLLQRVQALAAELEAQAKGEAPKETFFVAEQPGTTWAVINGTNAGETLNGTAGDDVLSGLGGNDVLNGGDGNDVLIGGAGVDTFNGGAGIDTLSFENETGPYGIKVILNEAYTAYASDTYATPGYSEYREYITGVENVIGSKNNDQISGTNGENLLEGRDGADRLWGYDGDDILIGGKGDDILWGQGGADTFVFAAGDGHDSVYDFVSGEDTVEITGFSSYTLVQEGGDTRVVLDANNSILLVGVAPAAVAPGDVVLSGGTTGTAGDDVLVATAGDDVIDGQGGNDTASFADATSGVSVDLTITGVQGTGGSGYDQLISIENLIGSDFDDTLIGDDGDNVLAGGAGDDILIGGGGDDVLIAGPGFNDFQGGDGVDTVDMSAIATGVTIALGWFGWQGGARFTDVENLIGTAFADNLSANISSGSLYGGAGDDVLRAVGYGDSLFGESGDDVLHAGPMADVLDGGDGNDTVSFATAASGVSVNLSVVGPQNTGGSGSDELISIENLIGSSHGDTLYGDGVANRLEGGGGDDHIVGGGGDDVVLGGAGADNLHGNYGNDYFHGGDGDDFISAWSGDDVIVGGVGNDTITLVEGVAGADTLVFAAGDGHDQVTGFVPGQDSIQVTGFASFWLVQEGAHLRVVFDANNSILLLNTDKADFDPATDINIPMINVVTGTAGDDVLAATADDDRFQGGEGSDTVSFAGATAGVTVDLTVTGPQDTGGSGEDEFVSIENLTGSSFNDVLTGDAGNNVLEGGAGDDVLNGGDGDDVLIAGPGDDVFDGGSGFDTLTFANAAYGVDVRASSLGDTGQGYDWIRSVEQIIGSDFNDWIVGNESSNDIFHGGGGDDFLYGGDGDDFLYGGDGNDWISGGTGTDWIDGGDGDDDIVAQGIGVKTIIGGKGDDLISLSTTHTTLKFAAGDGHDTVYGFSSSSDFIEVTGFDSFTLVQEGNDLRIVFDSDNSILLLDQRREYFDLNAVNIPLAVNAVTGTAGDDVLLATGDDDRIDGMGGSDTVSFAGATAGVTVDLTVTGAQATGGSGNDELISIENLTGSSFNDVLTGDSGNNILIGGAGNDILNGGDGDDVLIGGAGSDTLNGGAGVDTVSFANATGGVRVRLDDATPNAIYGFSTDTLSSVENIIGSAFDDYLYGDAGVNVIRGGAGNDFVIGRGGADFLYGEDGDDLFNLDDGDVAEGGAGADTFISLSGHSVINDFTVGEDFLDALGYRTVNLVQEGDDVRVVFSANHSVLLKDITVAEIDPADFDFAITMHGSEDGDVLTGSGASDYILGNGGDDVIVTGDGRNYAFGGEGNDHITGGASLDRLYGGAGDDVIVIGPGGADYLNGGHGNDTVSFEQASSYVRVTLGTTASQDTRGGGNNVYLASFENVVGSDFNDFIYGNLEHNVLQGGAGDDVLAGFGGNDVLIGGGGHDALIGGSGDDILVAGGGDTLVGDAGFDTADFSGAAGRLHLYLGNGGGYVDAGGVQFVYTSSIERVVGTAFNDYIRDDMDDSSDIVIEGGAGDDIIAALSGGQRTIAGGTGDDTIHLAYGAASVLQFAAGDGEDTIWGFTSGRDTIQVSGFASFTLVQEGPHLRVVFDEDNSILLRNVDKADFDVATDINIPLGINEVDGTAGDDVLLATDNDDRMDGMGGNDTASFANATAGVTVDLTIAGPQNTGGSGVDELISIENVIGSNFGDVITGDNGDNVLDGKQGYDVISGGGGDDVLSAQSGVLDGGSGDDTFDASGWFNAEIDLAAGTATGNYASVTLAGIENVQGGSSDDVILGDAGANALAGGAGDDRLSGRGGDDLLTGGAGADAFVFAAGHGHDTITDFAPGVDSIEVTGFTSYTLAQQGADLRIVFDANNSILLQNVDAADFEASDINIPMLNEVDGTAGDDILLATAGDDRFDGMVGSDTASFAGAASGVTVDLTVAGPQNTGGSGHDELISIENLIGSAFNDVLTGDAGNNILVGGAGADWLVGGDGDDVLFSGHQSGLAPAAADRLYGGAGNDLLVVGAGYGSIADGGEGVDTISFAHFTPNNLGNGVNVLLNSGFAMQGNTGIYMLVSGVENVIGSEYGDVIYGDDEANLIEGRGGDDGNLRGFGGDDVILGGDGDDQMRGEDGDDRLEGGAGQDLLRGGEGDDLLYGGTGNDWIFAEAGVDRVEGGAGDDRIFLAGSGHATLVFAAGDGHDTVYDFVTGGTDDRIEVSGFDAFTMVQEGAHLRLVFDENNSILLRNTDRADFDAATDINIPLAINYVDGTAGDDVLFATSGDDRFDGMAGSDTVSFATATSGVTVDLTVTGPQATGGSGVDELISIENLIGSNYDDVLIGDDGDNTINGGLGADLLRGGGGYDRMYAGTGDRVYGDGGDDLVFISGVADVHGGEGSDVLWANGSSGLIADLSAGMVSFQGASGSAVISGFENLYGSIHADVLTGDAGANTIVGADGNDVLDGGAGNDRIDGGLGADTLRGGEGNDIITTGGGDDTVEGGAGDDVISAGAGALTVSGGAGTDTLSFAMATSGVTVSLAGASVQTTGIGTLVLNGDVENLTGSDFNDRLTGNAAANTLTGGAGDDVLNGGSGADTTIGGFGNDWHFVDTANDTVVELAGQGFDRVFASTSWALGAGMEVEILSTAFQDGTQAIDLTGNELANTIVGNNGVNILTGGAGDDRLLGHGGDDVLIGGAGDDRMDGGLGVDTADFHGATGGVTVNLATQSATGQGNDVLLDIENVMGSAFNDVLNGSAAANVLTGGAGDDRLDGRAGADTTFGGLGDDWHFVDNAGDIVEELSGEGFDRVFASTSYVLAAGAEIEILSTNLQAGLAAIDLTGNAFGQSIVGNQGANRLDGGGGDDVLMGHGGDDFLIGGLGDDRIDGGLGFDTVDFSGAAAGVNANLTTRIATGEGADTLIDIERLVGTAFSDVLVGAAGANTLEGGAGDDRLDGRGGLDVTVGGLGNDWHYVDNAGDTVVELAGQGAADRVLASTSYTLAADAEIEVLSTTLQVGTAAINLTGNAFAQSIAGNDGVNRLDGGAGDDVLYGHGGDDVLIGGLGNDVLNGGLGNDTADYSAAASGISANLATGVVTGGAGTDTLIGVENVTGSAFADLLAGDAGANVLEGGAGDDTLTGGAGADVFLFQGTGTGIDRITDFTDGVDLIRFDGVAGVDDFSDLTIMGGNGPAGLGLRIVLPDGSTIYLQGVNAAQLSADDFIFGPG